MSNITVANIDRAYAVKGKSHLKLALRAAIQTALEAAPEEKRDTHRRYYASALKAEVGVKHTANAIAGMFLVEAINAAPVGERQEVEDALAELLDEKVSKPQVKIEPRSTAESICKSVGVPESMASKMIVATIS